MIPKKIHYCWLSGDPLPKQIKQCMETWQSIMPEYELVLWDTNKFDVTSIPFVHQAYQQKKWAFAADYIRLYALYTEGGIYLDTDVIVKQKFDKLLDYRFFTSVEKNVDSYLDKETLAIASAAGLHLPQTRDITVQAAVLGAVAKHPYLKACMEWYEDKNFINEEGVYFDKIVAPDIYAYILKQFGFEYKDKLQILPEDTVIYPSYTFPNGSLVGEKLHPETYAVHCFFGGWRTNSLRQELLKKLGNNRWLRRSFQKRTYKEIEEIINEDIVKVKG